MMALQICEENLPLITELNGGVKPDITADMLEYSAFFVFQHNADNDFAALMFKAEMRKKFFIRERYEDLYDCYLIEPK